MCRIRTEEMQRGEARPYLMGERQRPACVNCDRDELWSHFCQFKSHGPKCPPHDQDLLFNTLLDRCARLPACSCMLWCHYFIWLICCQWLAGCPNNLVPSILWMGED
jgi:hypothetical protein